MIELNKIYTGECLELLKRVDDNSVQCIFTDPPYNIGYEYDKYDDDRDDYWEWCEQWLRECYRVLRKDGSIFVKQYSDNMIRFAQIMHRVGFVHRNVIIWTSRSQANPHRQFLKEYEAILFMSKSDKNYFNRYGMTDTTRKTRHAKGIFGDVWHVKKVTAGYALHPEGIYRRGERKKVHSCQMPQELVRRAILHTTRKGDVVLDIFNGVGTTTAEAFLQQRAFIGIELSAHYNRYAQQRLKLLEKQRGGVAL